MAQPVHTRLKSIAQTSAVPLEAEWRRADVAMQERFQSGNTLPSRWQDCENTITDASVTLGADHHTITLALWPTMLSLATEGKLTHDGAVTFGMMQVAGPSVFVRGIFRRPCDFLHIQVSNSWLAEAHEERYGASWSGRLQKSDCGFVHDPVIDQLTRVLGTPIMINDELTRTYVDGIATAIASRVVALDNQFAAEAPVRISALAKWRLKRTIDYIDAHLGERILLADMAKSAGQSRMHFAAQFRAATGLGPHEYLLQRRIERAQALLRSSDAPIVDVAFEVGFANQAHFSTVFRRLIGQSPRRWRCDAPARPIVPIENPAVDCERPPAPRPRDCRKERGERP